MFSDYRMNEKIKNINKTGCTTSGLPRSDNYYVVDYE